MKNVGIGLSLLLSSLLFHPVTCMTEFGREVAHGDFDMDEAFRELMDFMGDSMSMSMSMDYDTRTDYSMEPSNTMESTPDPTTTRRSDDGEDDTNVPSDETHVPTEAPVKVPTSQWNSGDHWQSGDSWEEEESVLPTLPPSPKPVSPTVAPVSPTIVVAATSPTMAPIMSNNSTNVQVLLPASCDVLTFSTPVVARLTITTNANIVDFSVFVDTILSLLAEAIPSCLSLLEPNQRVRKLEDAAAAAMDVYFDDLSLQQDAPFDSPCCFEGSLQMTLYSDGDIDKQDVLDRIKDFILQKMQDLFLNLAITDGIIEVDLDLDDTMDGGVANGAPNGIKNEEENFKSEQKIMLSVVAICVVSSTLMVFAIQKVLARKSWHPVSGGTMEEDGHKFQNLHHNRDCLDDEEFSHSVTVAATEDPSKMSSV